MMLRCEVTVDWPSLSLPLSDLCRLELRDSWSASCTLRSAAAWPGSAVLQQFRHVHEELHATAAWKHSQYFFRHRDFLQRQPFLCATAAEVPRTVTNSAATAPDEEDGTAVGLNLESKAFGLRSRMERIASVRT